MIITKVGIGMQAGPFQEPLRKTAKKPSQDI
jgi:hypothetical protein